MPLGTTPSMVAVRVMDCMISVEKVAGGYLVSATPPHTKADYKSPTALSVREAIDELKKLGAHQTDIGDAFYAADPNWVL
jgi:hypothetical protein